MPNITYGVVLYKPAAISCEIKQVTFTLKKMNKEFWI